MENIIQEVTNLDLVKTLEEKGFKLTSTNRQLQTGTLQFRKYYKNEKLKTRFNKNDEIFQGYVIYANGTVRFETSGTDFFLDKEKNQTILFKGKPLETIDDYTDVLEYVVDLVKGKIDNKRYTKDSRNKLKSKIKESTVMSFSEFVLNESKSEMIKCDDSNIKQMVKDHFDELHLLDVSDVINMSELFIMEKRDIERIENWNVSNVKSMQSMFAGCTLFNADLSKWNVSNVKNMESMFQDCLNFDSDLSKWDVSKVQTMESMFMGCQLFNTDLSEWNTKNVKNMNYMFEDCERFNDDLSKWNVSKVQTYNEMFYGCYIKAKFEPKFK